MNVEDATISQYENLSSETLVTTINLETSFSNLNAASGTLTLSSLQGGTVTKIGNVSITELAVSDLSSVEGFATSVSFKDTPDNLLFFDGSYTQTVLENAESVEVTSGTTSPISLDEMKILSDVVNTFPPEFTLEVNASAKQIVDFATSSNTLENLAVADADVINVISGDPISVDQLSVLKGLDDVVLGSGTVDIADSDTKILAANDAVLGSAEVGIVTVNSGASTVTDGVSLNGMTKAVVFDVEGTAKDIVTNAGSLGEAANISATGGTAITVVEAQTLQGLPGYNASTSSYSIDDDAADIISATDSVLTNGNINVDVTDGDVSASDGSILNDFTADIDFSVDDNPAAVAAEVTGSNSSTDLMMRNLLRFQERLFLGLQMNLGLFHQDSP